MKILFLLGDAKYVITHRLSLMMFLKEKGYHVTIVCPQSPLVDDLQTLGLTVIPLDFDRGGMNIIKDMKAIKALCCLMRTHTPHILHAVAMKPTLNGLLATYFSFKKNISFVATWGGLGFLFISKKKSIQLIQFFLIKVFNFLFKRTKGHLILQNNDDQTLLKQKGLTVKTSLIRGSGVNPLVYSLTPEPPVPLSGPVVVYVGRLLKDKGLGEWIEAIKLLKQKGVRATYHIYGDLDQKNPASFELHHLKTWEKEGLIQWHGHTQDPSKAYAQAHIVVLPSYREGLPKSLLEAGAMGRALIATDVPGCRDIVHHTITGLLVPVYSVKPLADAMETLIYQKELREQLGTNVHNHVISQFSDVFIHDQHHVLYQNLYASKNI